MSDPASESQPSPQADSSTEDDPFSSPSLEALFEEQAAHTQTGARRRRALVAVAAVSAVATGVMVGGFYVMGRSEPAAIPTSAEASETFDPAAPTSTVLVDPVPNSGQPITTSPKVKVTPKGDNRLTMIVTVPGTPITVDVTINPKKGPTVTRTVTLTTTTTRLQFRNVPGGKADWKTVVPGFRPLTGVVDVPGAPWTPPATDTPTIPTDAPTSTYVPPTSQPTSQPTHEPTQQPTKQPTRTPTGPSGPNDDPEPSGPVGG